MPLSSIFVGVLLHLRLFSAIKDLLTFLRYLFTYLLNNERIAA